MEFPKGDSNAATGEYDGEYELVLEEVEEEVEEEIEEDELGGGSSSGGGEGKGDRVGVGRGESPRKMYNVDNGGDELKQTDASSSSAGKIFVGGVAWETTEERFSNHFSKYGEIIDSVIMKDKNTRMPRGFGFVTFADPYVIDKVLEDEHIIDGRTVEVKRTVPKEEMPSKAGIKSKKIFVGGIPTSLSEDELKEHFSSYGDVVEHQIMLDHSTGRSRGFGFVTFKSEEAVDKIISEGKMHDLAGKQVEIKRAEPKRSAGNFRAGYGPAGNARGYSGNSYSYGGDHRYDDGYFGGGAGYGYGRAYGYSSVPSYGAGFGHNYAGPIYRGGGGGYATGNMYGSPGSYSAWYGGHGSGRGYGSRYHPYDK